VKAVLFFDTHTSIFVELRTDYFFTSFPRHVELQQHQRQPSRVMCPPSLFWGAPLKSEPEKLFNHLSFESCSPSIRHRFPSSNGRRSFPFPSVLVRTETAVCRRFQTKARSVQDGTKNPFPFHFSFTLRLDGLEPKGTDPLLWGNLTPAMGGLREFLPFHFSTLAFFFPPNLRRLLLLSLFDRWI